MSFNVVHIFEHIKFRQRRAHGDSRANALIHYPSYTMYTHFYDQVSLVLVESDTVTTSA